MTDLINEKGAAPAPVSDSVSPYTLSTLLVEKDAKVSVFFDDLKQRKAASPDRLDFDVALEKVKSDINLLGRVAEIARIASEFDQSSVASPVLQWCANVLRASDEGLNEWMRIAGSDPHVQLRQLAKGLQSAKEKSEKVSAEARLTIGMAVLFRQFAMDPDDALRAVSGGLGGGPEKPGLQQSKDKARLGKILRRAGAGQLTNLATVVRLFDASVIEARRRMLEAETARQELYDKNLKLKAELGSAMAQVSSLSSECENFIRKIASLRAEIDGVKGDADHGEIELKARYRTMLLRRLRPYLNDASDALEADPPFPDVASERVKLGLAEIAKELEWLDKS